MQFELTPIRYVGEEHAMPADEQSAQYWGVYLRGDDGLAVHLVDCSTLTEAYRFVNRVDALDKLTVVEKIIA